MALNSSAWDISTTSGYGGTLLAQAVGNLIVQGIASLGVSERGRQHFREEGSIVLISRTPNFTQVVNLSDARKNSIAFSIEGNHIGVPPGREFSLYVPGTPLERVARRDFNQITMRSGRVLRDAEVSLPYFLTKHVILREVLSSTSPEDKKLSSNIRKMTACLAILKGTRGPFHPEH